MLTIQQAAHAVLKQANEPLKSIEIARRILEQQLIESNAKNPIQSISQALERNIRMNKGNTPELQFVDTMMGRQVDIVDKQPKFEYAPLESTMQRKVEVEDEVTVKLPKSLVDKVKIYQLGKGLDTLDDAFKILIRSGLASNSSELIEVIKKELETL